jgi:hypothetical protein
MNILDKIMAYEGGEMTMPEAVYFFSELVRTGMAWSLQGSYGRTAMGLIDAGVLMSNGDVDEMRAIELGIEM